MTVRVAEIEQQLREIWKGFSKGADSTQAITRAQVMNLIVYTSHTAAEPEITAALADTSAQSPGRMIVLIHDSTLPVSTMNSWVNALCHLSSGGRKQVCCEQIVIHAGDTDVARWSSVVFPLLIPDLSTFLWWHDSPGKNRELLRSISGACDRLIVDSQLTADLTEILSHFKAYGDDLAISDMNWARITPWRLALAGFYDHPQCRMCMDDLIRIEIDSHSPFESAGQSYLLLAWLGSSLMWQWAEKPQLRNRHGKRVEVILNWEKKERDQLQAVRLFSPASQFRIFLHSDGSHLQTEVRIGDKQVGGQVLKLPPQTLSAFLSQEVSILTRDEIYERSLRFLTT